MSIHTNNIIHLNQTQVLYPGQRVIKIGSYYFPVGFGNSYSTSMNFYKCASVDIQTQTWTGYKAISQGSYYYFEETATEGLSYLGNTIEIDKIYSSDGLIEIANLFNGLLSSEDGSLTLVVGSDSTYDESTGTLALNNGSVDENGVLNLNA